MAALLALAALVPVRPAAAQTATPELSSACFPATTSPFADRPSGEAGAAVDCVAYYGIARGVAPDSYLPNTPVSRQQMASFLVRSALVAGATVPAAADDHFPDDTGSVHEERINQLFELGITVGGADGLFNPNDPVSRGQLASFVARLLERIGPPLPEPAQDWFDDDAATVHEVRINQLADAGIVQGTEPRRFQPEASVTRAQMALFLARSLAVSVRSRDAHLARVDVADPTLGPDLLSAGVRSTAESTVTVAYDFDERPAGVPRATAFQLVTFEGQRTTATNLQRDADDPTILLATFERGLARLATTASLASGGVTDDAGRENVVTAVPLRPLELVAGTTAAPDLFSISRLGAVAVDFNFDERALVQAIDGFHLVLDDGTVLTSSGTGNDDAQSIVVFFTGLTASDADRVVRGYVDAGAVQDADATPIPQEAVDVFATGVILGRPDLVEVAVDPESDTATLTFDEPVQLGAGQVRLFRLNGTETSAAPRDALGPLVTVHFGPGETSQVAGISIDEGAVIADDDGAVNLVDDIGLPRPFAAGETAAPDLVRAARASVPSDEGSDLRSVLFVFDDPLELGAAPQLAVHDVEGRRTELTSCSSAGPSSVVCTGSAAVNPLEHEAIATAAVASVESDAVRDLTGSYGNHGTRAVL